MSFKYSRKGRLCTQNNPELLRSGVEGLAILGLKSYPFLSFLLSVAAAMHHVQSTKSRKLPESAHADWISKWVPEKLLLSWSK
jgi:hypothetical protein